VQTKGIENLLKIIEDDLSNIEKERWLSRYRRLLGHQQTVRKEPSYITI
jgi:hypothetical protein